MALRALTSAPPPFFLETNEAIKWKRRCSNPLQLVPSYGSSSSGLLGIGILEAKVLRMAVHPSP